jgi:hypothetical protein
MGLAERPPVPAVAGAQLVGQTRVLARGTRGSAAPPSPPGPLAASARGRARRVPGIRRGCLVHVVLTAWERHPRRIGAGDGREGERNRSHGSRGVTPEPSGSPARNELRGRDRNPRRKDR